MNAQADFLYKEYSYLQAPGRHRNVNVSTSADILERNTREYLYDYLRYDSGAGYAFRYEEFSFKLTAAKESKRFQQR